MKPGQPFTHTFPNQSPAKPTIFIGGLPKDLDLKAANAFMKSMVGNRNYNIITDSKCKLRGFAFVTFNSEEEANLFLQKEHRYKNKVLDCKFSLEHDDYITASLINIREPKKIFIDDIPKQFTKSRIVKYFETFGDIEEAVLIEKCKKPFNFSYIHYYETESAQKAVKNGFIELDKHNILPVIYARPKFSKKMLENIPFEIREYIKSIQKNKIEYDPVEFAKIEDMVMKDFNVKDKESFYVEYVDKCSKDKFETDGMMHNNVNVNSFNSSNQVSHNSNEFNNNTQCYDTSQQYSFDQSYYNQANNYYPQDQYYTDYNNEYYYNNNYNNNGYYNYGNNSGYYYPQGDESYNHTYDNSYYNYPNQQQYEGQYYQQDTYYNQYNQYSGPNDTFYNANGNNRMDNK